MVRPHSLWKSAHPFESNLLGAAPDEIFADGYGPERDRRVSAIDLAIGRREPRNAIDALLDLDGMRLRVVATHLGLAATERHVQAGWLAQRVRADRTPCVVLGDFNEWRAVGALAPLRDMVAGRAPATFPSALPIASLDRILAQPASLVRERHVPASPLVRIASDHRPLIATIALDRLA